MAALPHPVLAGNPAQQKLLDAGLLSTGFSWVLQMPTGSGKTWLAEQAIHATLTAGHRAVYLTPLRALANELGERWWGRFAPWRVGVYTGETTAGGRGGTLPFSEADVLILTPERLDACTRAWRSHWSWLPEVELLVVDEIHLLGDRERGPRLEGTLLRARRLNPFLRVLGLSATLGNREEIAEWLDGLDHHSHWRSVPLSWRIRRFRKADEKPGLLTEEVSRCLADSGQSLVFVQSRRRAEHLAAELSRQGLPAAHHHGGLAGTQRTSTEGAFRSGRTPILVSTGTLEMGLNLPVRQVVLYDLQAFDGTDFVPLPVTTVWQRAGRAGRPGLDPHGEVVLLAPSWDRTAERYPHGHFEPVRSGLAAPRALAEQVLVEVGAGLSRDSAQLQRALGASLAQRQQRLPDVRGCVATMVGAGMLKEVPDERVPTRILLKATRLGRIAVRQLLAPESVLHLARHAAQDPAPTLTFFDLLLLATTTPDCEPIVPADFEELDDLGARLAREPTTLLHGSAPAIAAQLGVRGRRLLAAIKTALIARTWTRTGDMDATADAHGVYPFEVRRLTESLERVLSALVALLTPAREPDAPADPSEPVPLAEDAVPLLERARALLAMVSHGVDEETVTLTYLPGIGGTLARRLREAGFSDIEVLAQAEPAEVARVRGVSLKRATEWVNEATARLPTHSPWRLREAGPTATTSPTEWPEGLDPYRLGRARELQVTHEGAHEFRVTGGLEPHRVSQSGGGLTCDCPDHRAGHTCKHVLAVRLSLGDRALATLAARLARGQNDPTSFDLFALWLDRRERSR